MPRQRYTLATLIAAFAAIPAVMASATVIAGQKHQSDPGVAFAKKLLQDETCTLDQLLAQLISIPGVKGVVAHREGEMTDVIFTNVAHRVYSSITDYPGVVVLRVQREFGYKIFHELGMLVGVPQMYWWRDTQHGYYFQLPESA